MCKLKRDFAFLKPLNALYFRPTCLIIVTTTTKTSGATEVKGVTGGSGRLSWILSLFSIFVSQLFFLVLLMLFPHLYNGNNEEVEICYSSELSKQVEEDEVEQSVFWTFDCVVAEGNLKRKTFQVVERVQTCVSVSSWSWKGSCLPPTGTILLWNQRADFREESRA